MNKVISKVLSVNDDINRKKIIQFIADKLSEKYILLPIPDDLRKEFVKKEVDPYLKFVGKRIKVIGDVWIQRSWHVPNQQVFPNFISAKSYILNLINNWIGGDLDNIYFFDGFDTIKIDKQDILTRNATEKSKKKWFGGNKLFSKLIEEGMIILKVFRKHYLTFHKDKKTGKFIATSTLDTGLHIE
jgi:hypothetical protein